ncbi:MAG: serine hydrolase domain-containing protein [Thermomicrobiales bacterium]
MGALAEARGFGVTSADDSGLPVTPQTLFQIGSTTKPLTGTLVMRLVAAGLLDLGRPVIEYLPTFRLAEPGAAERVTLRLLLSHTAGLPWDQITPTRLHGRRDPAGLPTTCATNSRRARSSRRPAPAGSTATPASTSPRTSPKLSPAAPTPTIAEYITAPLGMARTTFDPAVALTYPAALSHDLTADGTLIPRHRAPDNTAQYPSAFAHSTVLDLANFALLHLQSGRFGDAQLLPPDLAAAMHAPQADCGLDPANGPSASYGLTFFLTTILGRRCVGHPGGVFISPAGFLCSYPTTASPLSSSSSLPDQIPHTRPPPVRLERAPGRRSVSPPGVPMRSAPVRTEGAPGTPARSFTGVVPASQERRPAAPPVAAPRRATLPACRACSDTTSHRSRSIASPAPVPVAR